MSKEILILLMVLNIISILIQKKLYNLSIIMRYSVIDYINDMLLSFGRSEEINKINKINIVQSNNYYYNCKDNIIGIREKSSQKFVDCLAGIHEVGHYISIYNSLLKKLELIVCKLIDLIIILFGILELILLVFYKIGYIKYKINLANEVLLLFLISLFICNVNIFYNEYSASKKSYIYIKKVNYALKNKALIILLFCFINQLLNKSLLVFFMIFAISNIS